MTREDFERKVAQAYERGEIDEQEKDLMLWHADIFDDEPDNERFPEGYAEIEYGERIWDDPEAMDGARFDDMNYTRYFER